MTSRGPIVWASLALINAAIPAALVVYYREPPNNLDAIAFSTSGPWVGDARGVILFVCTLGVVAVSAGALLHGIVTALQSRRPGSLLPYVACSLISYGLAVGLSQWWWLID